MTSGILKHDEDDHALPPPSYSKDYASSLGEPSQLDTDKLTKYPPLIPLPDAPKPKSTFLVYGANSKVNKNYKREENFSIDELSEMIQEPAAEHASSDLSFDAGITPKSFYLQPTADITTGSPATLGGSSGLVARDNIYQQVPESTAAASQLLLLPIIAMWLKSIWPALGNAGRNTGRRNRRSLAFSPRRQHARSWSMSKEIHAQESLD